MDDAAIRSLAGERAAAVLEACADVATAVPTPPVPAATVDLALHLGREQVAAAPHAALLQLPLAIHERLAGDWRPAIPVAAACHLLYLGADLLDNVADHELPSGWEVWGPEQAALVACTLLYPLSQRAAARVPAPPEVRLAILGRLAEGARAMAAGQQEELRRSVWDDVDPEAAWQTSATKTGAEGGAACEVAGLLAGAPPERVEALADFGRSYATALQVASDCRDVWGQDVSADLANARPTPPVAYGLWATPPAERPALRRRILEAGWNARAQAEVRAALARQGALTYCALRVRALQHEAAAALERAGVADQPLLRFLLERVWPWGDAAAGPAAGCDAAGPVAGKDAAAPAAG